MISQLLKFVSKTKKYKDLYKIPFNLELSKIPTTKIKTLKIVLLCISCYGLGDIIFCLKIYHYIKKWYNIDCTILTTRPDIFVKNNIKNVKKLSGYGNLECQNPKKLKPVKLNKFDIIFVTPWLSTEYAPNISYLANIFPYSNKFNTFIFSEYNVPKDSFDFPTGVGKNMMGLLITEPPKKLKKLQVLKNPYIVSYIAEWTGDVKCLSNFIKYVCNKYSSKKNLDILIPKFISDKTLLSLSKYISKKKYFSTFQIGTLERNKNIIIHEDKYDDSFGVLTFRRLENLAYSQFVNLFRYCLPDVLLTGDQSITDIISCCHTYNIFYQVLPWKKNLATNLGKILGSHLSKVSTSCGLEKLSYNQKSQILNLRKNYNFTLLGKPKMDNILNTVYHLKHDQLLKDFYDIVIENKSISKVLKNLDV